MSDGFVVSKPAMERCCWYLTQLPSTVSFIWRQQLINVIRQKL